MFRFLTQKEIKIPLLTIGLVFFLVLIMAKGISGYTLATRDGHENNHRKSGLELTVNSEAVYNGMSQPTMTWQAKNLVPQADKFFDFQDVKPGDSGNHLISLHVKKNNAYVCLDFKNLENHENGTTEPEGLVDTEPGGELAKNLEFFAWRDDGDNEFEVGERVVFGTTTRSGDILLASTTYAVADAGTGNTCRADSVNYVGILWCAGDLQVDLDTAEVVCKADGMGNETQTDSMTVDVALRAVQAKYNKGFTCANRQPPQDTPPPEDEEDDNQGSDHSHDNDPHTDHASHHEHNNNPAHDNDTTDDSHDAEHLVVSDDFYPVAKEERTITSVVLKRLNEFFASLGWINNT